MKVLNSIWVLPALVFSACAPHGSERWWINQIDKVHDRYSLTVNGIEYDTAYKAVGSTVGFSREESPEYGYDAIVLGSGSGNMIPMIYDSGLPLVVVARADGLDLKASDYEFAISVAERVCQENPDWKRDTMLAYDQPSPFPATHPGTAFLRDGAWSIYEICE